MNHPTVDDARLEGIVIEEAWVFTLSELALACDTEEARVIELVDEGVLDPAGSMPQEWLFSGPSLQTTQRALRLIDELHIGTAGAALALILLDDIDHLRGELREALAAARIDTVDTRTGTGSPPEPSLRK